MMAILVTKSFSSDGGVLYFFLPLLACLSWGAQLCLESCNYGGGGFFYLIVAFLSTWLSLMLSDLVR